MKITTVARAHLYILLYLEVVADAAGRLEQIEVVQGDLNVMVLGQIDGEVTGLDAIGAKRAWIMRTVDYATEGVYGLSRRITQAVGWLTVVVELCIVRVALTVRLQTSPGVANVAEGLVSALGQRLFAVTARVGHVRTECLVVLQAVGEPCVAHHLRRGRLRR